MQGGGLQWLHTQLPRRAWQCRGWSLGRRLQSRTVHSNVDMTPFTKDVSQGVLAGDRVSLSRAITLGTWAGRRACREQRCAIHNFALGE